MIWACQQCKLHTVELCPLGPVVPKPGACLSCGGQIGADGRCRQCEAPRAALIEQVREHCGDLPQLEAIDALAERGLFSLAIGAIDHRLEQLPNDQPTLVAKAELMTEVRRPARAVLLLRRALELGERTSAVVVDLGVALADSGEPEQALGLYHAQLELETKGHDRALIFTNIGSCLSALGRPDEAESFHRQAVEADPQNLGRRWELFAHLVERRSDHEALTVVEQAIALPGIETAERENLQAFRAEMLIAAGRYPEALAAIDASLASDPEEAERLCTRARILMHLGQ